MLARKDVKRLAFAALCGLSLSVGALPVHANFMGSDDFNDNVVDASKWGTDIGLGNGVLSEINSRLEYTVTVPDMNFDTVDRPWILNQGSYVRGWDVQLDVGLGDLNFQAGAFNFAAMALYVENADDPGRDGALIELGVFDGIGRNFLANFFIDQAFAGPSVFTPTTSQSAAVRIAFDAITKDLVLAYDQNGPIGGYQWTALRTENLGPWNMTSSSKFNVFVSPGSSGQVIGSGLVTADNFIASSVPEPATLALFGLGLAGLGLQRRRRAA